MIDGGFSVPTRLATAASDRAAVRKVAGTHHMARDTGDIRGKTPQGLGLSEILRVLGIMGSGFPCQPLRVQSLKDISTDDCATILPLALCANQPLHKYYQSINVKLNSMTC